MAILLLSRTICPFRQSFSASHGRKIIHISSEVEMIAGLHGIGLKVSIYRRRSELRQSVTPTDDEKDVGGCIANDQLFNSSSLPSDRETTKATRGDVTFDFQALQQSHLS